MELSPYSTLVSNAMAQGLIPRNGVQFTRYPDRFHTFERLGRASTAPIAVIESVIHLPPCFHLFPLISCFACRSCERVNSRGKKEILRATRAIPRAPSKRVKWSFYERGFAVVQACRFFSYPPLVPPPFLRPAEGDESQ